MQLTPDPRPLTAASADDGVLLMAVPVNGGDDGVRVAADAGDLDVARLAELTGFDGSRDATVRVPAPDGSDRAVLLVGLGDDTGSGAVRRFGAHAARAAAGAGGLALALPSWDGLDARAAAQALAEGVVLGCYRFGGYKTGDTPDGPPTGASVHGDVPTDALGVGRVLAEATALARDLVNTPPNDKRPAALARRARAETADLDLAVRVLDGDDLRAGGYGGLLAVGRGSEEDPRLVELRWAPDDAPADAHVGLVGKGITFDTGGISLKPTSSMETMKMDMGGAAAVLATMVALARLRVPLRVTGLLAIAENMPSGTATRVSDVITMRDGTSVEVMNTDAEGRLVMADAIAHAGELDVDTIVDVATLTGAASVALGDKLTVLMADDDDLAAELDGAGARAGEPTWRLPVAHEYRERLDSDVADLKNVGGRPAGTITAGLFLHHFVAEGVAWAHLDIAGTAWAESAGGELTVGATGTGARTLVEWLRGRAA